MTSSARKSPPVPLPNTYWVQPGRLLAGEYPGSMSRADAMERVQKLLRAGIDSFIDLTEDGELPEYDNMLPGLSEQRVRHRRMPIVDHGLPESTAYMSRILDRIDEELAAGRNVYVHCHAGIGRTGMTMACHLIRHGLQNHEALERLRVLWQACARSRRWPSVPETPEQVAFVRDWQDVRGSGVGSEDLRTRYEGALVGLAVGDALGTLVAVSNYDAATLVAALRDSLMLTIGIHTATTRAVAESLLAASGHDPEDQMQRYLQWTRDTLMPVPADFKRAVSAWQWSRKPNAGSHDPRNLDSHTLARTLAAAMFSRRNPAAAIDLAAEISRTTQQSPLVLDLCRLWAGLLVDALSGVGRDGLLAYAGPATRLIRQRPLRPAIEAYLQEQAGTPVANAEDAMSVTRIAIAAFAATTNFRDALVHLETHWHAPPSAAALCGALAGAHYGIDAIPMEWRQRLPDDAVLRCLARHLSA